MRWGFSREAGPFETWDMIGVIETIEGMQAAGFPPAKWVEQMVAAGCSTFYKYAGGIKTAVYNPGSSGYQVIERPPAMIVLKELKSAGKVIKRKPGATLLDMGDGVALVEFHTKMNSLDEDILTMIQEGLDIVDNDFEGMVIGNEADNFSGANLFFVVMAAQGACGIK
jgi:3-hydroxyacyl-CoA dehydrogenase